MGLGLGFQFAKTGRFSSWKAMPGSAQLAQKFLRIASGRSTLGPLARHAWSDENTATVLVLPIEEHIEFRQEGKTVQVFARTSSAGPGYHAYLVGLLDDLARQSGLELVETEEVFDETEYFSGRDFADLQGRMGDHFAALCRLVLERADEEGPGRMVLAMSIDDTPILDAFTLTPRGPKDRSFIEKADAASYFSWWHEGLQPASAATLAEGLMWSQFPWREAVTDDEVKLTRVLGELLSLAGDGETSQRARFDLARTSVDRPAREGLGYRRYDYRRQIGREWWVDVPGYFLFQFDENDGTHSYAYYDREMYFTSLWVDGGEGPVESMPVDSTPDPENPLFMHRDGMVWRANVQRHEYDGNPGWRLDGRVQSKAGQVVATIVFFDEADRAWAEKTFFSIGP